MPKRNGTAAGGFAKQSSDSGLNLQKVFFAGWQAAKEGFLYDRRSIVLQAKDAMKNAYAPYSRIPGRGGAFSEGWGGFQGLQR